jgi:ATP/maltotriose-dependent transcriptional regulator MalT
MAQRLGIGTATVKDHLDNLYGKLGVSDRLGAVRVASALGLVDLLR